MKTAWFTFGQGHVHKVNGVIFDKDCVVEITDEDPRETMFRVFGRKWAMQHDQPMGERSMRFYPRGIIKLFGSDEPNIKCFLHPEREATTHLKVPCAPGGKIHICAECKADPDISAKTFAKYSESHSKRIHIFKTPPNPGN